MAGDQIVDGRAAASYGTWMPVVPVFCQNSAAVRWSDDPVPDDANVTLPGFFLRCSISSRTLLAGKAGIRHQHVGRAHRDAQQIEILLRIVSEILEQRRIDGEHADRSDQQRVAVGGRLLERHCAERAVGAGPLSMTTDCFTRSASFGVTSRAVMSEAPPAGTAR